MSPPCARCGHEANDHEGLNGGCSFSSCLCVGYLIPPLDISSDPVNHPSHYTTGKIEVWDFIIDQKLSYLLGNVVKYVSRAGKKDKEKTLEDLKKARAYLNKEIETLEAE